jgi:hypothetical protein
MPECRTGESMQTLEITFGGEKRDLNKLMFALFETDSIDEQTRKELPGGALLEMRPMQARKGANLLHFFDVAVSFGAGVGSSLVAAYIYDKLKKQKGKRIRMLVERREIHVTKSGLIKIIEERIKKEEES